MLWQHGITDMEQISQLTWLTKRVVQQYIDLLPDKVRYKLSKNLDSNNKNANLNLSGETETGAAEEQPVRDSRTEATRREQTTPA